MDDRSWNRVHDLPLHHFDNDEVPPVIDERDGRRAAERRGLAVLGTLRVLADAAEHGLADLPAAFDRLRQTNFRASEPLLQSLLARDTARRRTPQDWTTLTITRQL